MAILVDAELAAAEVGLNPFTIRKLGAAGKVGVYRHGTAVRFNLEEIVQYMRAEGHERPVLTRARRKK
jgi:hypothetical protein